MSAKADTERSEARIAARIELAKAQLRLAQLVLTAYADGLGIAETAERIGRSRTVAWRVRVWLGVQSGRRSNGVRAARASGRRATKAALLEVRP